MAQVTSRDHAYSPDAAALRAPTVPMTVAPLPPSHIAPLPQSLTYTPPSSTFPTSASSSSVPPLSASSISTNFKFGTPPPISPTTGTGLFARRGSILPKVGDTSKSTPSRSSKMEEELEMNTVKPVVVDEAKIKEEQAMAKWRKWAVEQPPQAIAVTPTPAPSLSPLRLKPHTIINVSPGISPSQSRQNSGVSPLSPGRSERSPSGQAGPSKRPSRVDDDVTIFNTESVLALRDVELAIDEDILKSNEGRSRLGSRRMSVVPPPYPESNPFCDIASRLSSRRVRPLVLELIQALGHYIDAVWAMEHPGKPCPWAEPPESTPSPQTTDQPNWRSKMISAVAAGKKAGHVEVPITARDARFWEEEVKHGIKDSNLAVGIYHGDAWTFDTAIMEGRYGEIHKENVIRGGEHEGGITRLLHDLEEALWGEAAPRDTDLAFEVPFDFDPFARLEEDSPKSPAPTPQEQGNTTDPLAAATAPKPMGTGLIVTTSNGSGTGPAHEERRIMKVNDWDAALNLGAFKKEGEEEVSLEELGRRRHQQWLESRKADGWDV